jgi:hypothetical protein
MRVQSTLIFAAAALAAESAAAAHCPLGQLYRVKLDKCVSLTSALARPYLGEGMRLVKPVRMAKRIDPGFVDPPEARDPAPSKAEPPDDPPERDNWVWFPLPPDSAALWGHPADPPGLLRRPEGTDSGPWPSLPRQWPPE